MNKSIISKGFTLAAFMNFSVLIFSRGFTNEVINDFAPVVMSNFGLLMIVMWGLAYLACANIESNIKWIAGVFAIEKFIYGFIWLKWILTNNLTSVYNEDLFAGIFYSIYGINDLTFMLFFIWVFVSKQRKTSQSIS